MSLVCGSLVGGLALAITVPKSATQLLDDRSS